MQTQISEIVESAISNLTKVAEVNTIIGKPIVTYDGSTILPISQITFAFMAGGGEYGNKNLARSFAKNNLDANFAGGSGGGATMKPIGFLVIGKNGVEGRYGIPEVLEIDGAGLFTVDKTIPTYSPIPSGKETGTFMGIDVGGTNLRVLILDIP